MRYEERLSELLETLEFYLASLCRSREATAKEMKVPTRLKAFRIKLKLHYVKYREIPQRQVHPY